MSKATMTKRDFERIATALRDGRDALLAFLPESAPRIQRIHAGTCGSIARVLALQNARFDRAKFLAACGISPANTI